MRDVINLRPLSIDELDAVSGGKKKQITIIERCTTTIGKDGREVQTCRQVKEILH